MLLRLWAPKKIHGVILILEKIIESFPEVYSLLKEIYVLVLQLLLHLKSDDSAQLPVKKKKKQNNRR
ncbi:hypothetical protein Bca52824_034579 [Brassica carinata]|uniref:Uncharacterized protein n=1 Tax=Brassica carinata TaxID=52824 RepID=A0A8X7S1T1_BRACI|nr:hypothetical protein Bca52824_034579 [Brassica carinata]